MSRFTTSSSVYGSFYTSYEALPPRSSVVEPQQALLSALATPTHQMGAPSQMKCSKCDGPHADERCPHFSEERNDHQDVRSAKSIATESVAAPASIRATLVPQPGDGSCLFHSLSHFFGASAEQLRQTTAHTVEANPALEISGTALSKWIEWDSGLRPSAYAARLQSATTWGGALELAVIAATLGVVVHVYEPKHGSEYKRIATFGGTDEGSFTSIAHIAYRGRSHYDALAIH